MNYSDSPNHVRIDVFKSSGKWSSTHVLDWHELAWDDGPIHDSFHRLIRDQFENIFEGMTIVCLEPCHKNAHPLMIRNFQA